MKLTYWIAQQDSDSMVYDLRAKTKRELVAKMNDPFHADRRYGTPHKVTVEYNDAFDLMKECFSEGAGYWEST